MDKTAFQLNLLNHKIPPSYEFIFQNTHFHRYYQHHPNIFSFSGCVAFFLIFYSSNYGDDSEFQWTFGSKRIKKSRYDLSLFDVFLLRKTFKQINQELIKHFTSFVINQNLYRLHSWYPVTLLSRYHASSIPGTIHSRYRHLRRFQIPCIPQSMYQSFQVPCIPGIFSSQTFPFIPDTSQPAYHIPCIPDTMHSRYHAPCIPGTMHQEFQVSSAPRSYQIHAFQVPCTMHSSYRLLPDLTI